MQGKPMNGYVTEPILYNEFYNRENLFTILIAGTRTYNDYQEFSAVCDYMLSCHDYIQIVSGGANGTDAMAKRYAKEHNILIREFYAEWDRYGNKAGYIRNKAMHEFLNNYKQRGVLLFWDGKSPGTKQSIPLAKQYKNPITIYNFITGHFDKHFDKVEFDTD